MDKANKSKTAKKKRPLRRAQRFGRELPRMAGKLLLTLFAVTVMGLMFSALQAIESVGLRIALSLVIFTGALMVYISEGANKGAADAAASRFYVSAKERGVALADKDDAACYHPLKALSAALIAFGIPVALAVAAAVCAKEYTYVMQDVPRWMTDSYGSRADVMAPLGAYSVQQSMQATDWIRLIVRLPILIMVNLFPDAQTMSAVIDRLSPLMMMVYPVMYVIGYLLGPKINRKVEKQNRRAKKVAVRKTQKSSLVEELTGARPQVHYGQRREEDKHKRKELI